jgi:hypothetical protein
VLGVPLDKSVQCSAWHKRPLSDEQLVYAATDAAVLLALLDSLTAHALPSEFPFLAPNKLDCFEGPAFCEGSPEVNSSTALSKGDGVPGIVAELGDSHSKSQVLLAAAGVAPKHREALASEHKEVADAAKHAVSAAGAEHDRSCMTALGLETMESNGNAVAARSGHVLAARVAASVLDGPLPDTCHRLLARRQQAGVVGAAAWAERGRMEGLGTSEASEKQGTLGFGSSKVRVSGPSTSASGPLTAPSFQFQQFKQARLHSRRPASSLRASGQVRFPPLELQQDSV